MSYIFFPLFQSSPHFYDCYRSLHPLDFLDFLCIKLDFNFKSKKNIFISLLIKNVK
jgi:hypothetical protein